MPGACLRQKPTVLERQKTFLPQVSAEHDHAYGHDHRTYQFGTATHHRVRAAPGSDHLHRNHGRAGSPQDLAASDEYSQLCNVAGEVKHLGLCGCSQQVMPAQGDAGKRKE